MPEYLIDAEGPVELIEQPAPTQQFFEDEPGVDELLTPALQGPPGPSSMVPTLIAADAVWTVPQYSQVLFHDPITVDGVMVVLGRLIQVG